MLRVLLEPDTKQITNVGFLVSRRDIRDARRSDSGLATSEQQSEQPGVMPMSVTPAKQDGEVIFDLSQAESPY